MVVIPTQLDPTCQQSVSQNIHYVFRKLNARHRRHDHNLNMTCSLPRRVGEAAETGPTLRVADADSQTAEIALALTLSRVLMDLLRHVPSGEAVTLARLSQVLTPSRRHPERVTAAPRVAPRSWRDRESLGGPLSTHPGRTSLRLQGSGRPAGPSARRSGKGRLGRPVGCVHEPLHHPRPAGPLAGVASRDILLSGRVDWRWKGQWALVAVGQGQPHWPPAANRQPDDSPSASPMTRRWWGDRLDGSTVTPASRPRERRRGG